MYYQDEQKPAEPQRTSLLASTDYKGRDYKNRLPNSTTVRNTLMLISVSTEISGLYLTLAR